MPIKNILLITCLFFQISYSSYGQTKPESDKPFQNTVSSWFSAWELVYKDIYRINTIETVDFVLFDHQYVYSTSDITVGNGNPVIGPKILNLNLNWKKKKHGGFLTLPDGSTVPVRMMCFAAPNSKKNTSPFFVMPLTSFWSSQSVDSESLGLDNLVLGVFLHEFSHTQQMNNFGKTISQFVDQYQLGENFDDNYIQTTFQNNSVFTNLYHKEVSYFHQAVVDSPILDRNKTKEGLKLMADRRNQFFTTEYSYLQDIEDLFLTMEGLGQYTMYLWLTHPKGGNIGRLKAIEGVRRNKKKWSQDEGFLLFLILERLQPSKVWAKEMFGNKVVNVTDILDRLLKT